MEKTQESQYLRWSELVPNFGDSVKSTNKALSSAELFASLLDIENHPHCLGQAFHFVTGGLDKVRSGIKINLELAPSEFASSLVNEASQLLTPLPQDPFARSLLIKNLSPSYCIQGSWLQHAVRLSMCESRIGALFLKQYAIYLGVVRSHISEGERFQNLMGENGIEYAEFGSHHFFEDLGLSQVSQEYGLLDLAISFFPRTFLPELVGFNLWKSYFANFDLSEVLNPQSVDELRGLALQSVAELLEINSASTNRRICEGFWLAHLAYNRIRQASAGETELWNLNLNAINLQDFEIESDKFWSRIKNQKDLFYFLINYDVYPVLRPKALREATHMTERNLKDVRTPDFKEGAIEDFLQQQFKIETERYFQWSQNYFPKWQNASSLQKESIKEKIAESILRLTPSAATDGSWMLGACDIATSGHLEARLLFKTYFEEMGAGDLKWNHVAIHRKHLLSMGVDLPPLDDIKFAETLPNDIFYPNWFLLISLFPQHFLPEAIGINMAIEPFGVGGIYKIQNEFWTYLGMDATNARIHNSIDNQATGHSRVAAQAIESLLSRKGSFSPLLWQRVCGTLLNVSQLISGYGESQMKLFSGDSF